jgi:hypothetical protein
MKILATIAAAGLASSALASGQIGTDLDSMMDIDSMTRGTSNFTTTVNLNNAESWDAQGSPLNTIITVNVGVGNQVTGLGWDLDIETVGASWLSEVVFSFGDSVASPGLFLTAGVGNDVPGTMNFSSGGVLDLSDNGIPNLTIADGILEIEIFESYDDVAGDIDAFINGSLTIGLLEIPAPGAAALFGLGGLAAARRRR